MWIAQLYINNAFIGSGEIGLVQVREHAIEPKSIAYFCRRCGDIWARIVVCTETPNWDTHFALCAQHGLGSIWWSYDRQYMAALPYAIIEHEFLLAMENRQWFEYRQRERGSDGRMIPIRPLGDASRFEDEPDDVIPIDDF